MSQLTLASESQTPQWNWGGTFAYLRIFASASFYASDGTFVAQGAPGSNSWYKEYICTVSGTVLTIPQVVLETTLDSSVESATYTANIYDSTGAYRFTKLGQFVVSDELGSAPTQTSGALIVGHNYTITSYVAGDDFTNVGASSNANGVIFLCTGTTPTTYTNGSVLTDNSVSASTWEALTIANQGVQLNFFNQTWAIPQIVEYVNRFQNPLPYASDVLAGKILIDSTPAIPTEPTAVGITSNRIEVNLNSDFNNDLATAIAAYPINSVTLVIKNAVTISSNTSVPSNITLDIKDGGLVTVASGKTLTIASMTDAPNRQIFAGPGAVVLSTGATSYISLAWFSADDPATSSWGMTQCIASLGSGGRLLIPVGTWTVDGNYIVPNGVVIEGTGNHIDSLKGSTVAMSVGSPETNIFIIGNVYRDIIFRDLNLDTGTETPHACVAIDVTVPTGVGILFDNVSFSGTANTCVQVLGTGSIEVEQIMFNHCTFTGATQSLLYIDSVNGCVSLDQPFFLATTNVNAIHLESCGAFVMTNHTANCTTLDAGSVLYVNGPHLDINVIGGQDEGFIYSIYNNHDNSAIQSTFNLYGVLPQGFIHLEKWALINIVGGKYFCKSITATVNGGVVQAQGYQFQRKLGDIDKSIEIGGAVLNPPELCDFTGTEAIHLTDMAFNNGTVAFATSHAHRFLTPLKVSQMPNNSSNAGATSPLVSISTISTDTANKYLLYLGQRDADYVPTNGYYFYRDSDGVLQVTGNQAGFINLNFNGPMYASQFTPTAFNATTITGPVDDYNPLSDLSGILRVNVTGGSWNITGIAAPVTYPASKGFVGKFVNISATNSLTFKHDITSTAANRFYCPNNQDLTVPPNGAVDLYYDNTSTRWRVFPCNLGKSLDATNIADGSVTNTEFQYINTLTSNAQTQITNLTSTVSGKVDATSILRKRVTADVTNATAVMSDLTDLSMTLVAGHSYVGEIVIKCDDSTAAEGISFDFDGGASTMTEFAAGSTVLTGGTSVAVTEVSSALATDINYTTITNETWIMIKISLKVNAGGTFIPRFCQGTAHTTGTATVSKGTYLTLTDLA